METGAGNILSGLLGGVGQYFWCIQPSAHLCLCTPSRVNCSFYFRIGAFRHGDQCSRLPETNFQAGETWHGAWRVKASRLFPFRCPSCRGPAFSGYLRPTLLLGFFLVGPLLFLPQPTPLGCLSLLGPPSAGFLRDMHR